jgi:hypothetical protein
MWSMNLISLVNRARCEIILIFKSLRPFTLGIYAAISSSDTYERVDKLWIFLVYVFSSDMVDGPLYLINFHVNWFACFVNRIIIKSLYLYVYINKFLLLVIKLNPSISTISISAESSIWLSCRRFLTRDSEMSRF